MEKRELYYRTDLHYTILSSIIFSFVIFGFGILEHASLNGIIGAELTIVLPGCGLLVLIPHLIYYVHLRETQLIFQNYMRRIKIDISSIERMERCSTLGIVDLGNAVCVYYKSPSGKEKVARLPALPLFAKEKIIRLVTDISSRNPNIQIGDKLSSFMREVG